jgi:hypothetical protein
LTFSELEGTVSCDQMIVINTSSEKAIATFPLRWSVFQGLSIIEVSLRKLKLNDFSLVVYYQMQFEPKEPADGRFSFGSPYL